MGIKHRNWVDYGMRDPGKLRIIEKIQDSWRAINKGLGRREDQDLPMVEWRRPTRDTGERFGISKLSIPPLSLRHFASTAGRGGAVLESLDAVRRAVMEGTDLSNIVHDSELGHGADDGEHGVRGNEGPDQQQQEALSVATARRAMTLSRIPERRRDAELLMAQDATTAFLSTCRKHLQRNYALTTLNADLAFDGDGLMNIFKSVINAGGLNSYNLTLVRNKLAHYMANKDHTGIRAAIIMDEKEIYEEVAPRQTAARTAFLRDHIK